MHLIAAFLVVLLLQEFGLRFAWLGGILFAVHPLTVESVAWISELKNTLALPLILLAAIAFLKWDRRRSAPWWTLSVLAFSAAMLAKSVVAPLPAWLLLYLWWRHQKLGRRDWLATLPFWIVSLGLSAVTVHFQLHRAMQSDVVPEYALASRLEGAGFALVFYVGKTVWPLGLTPMYPTWNLSPVSASALFPWLTCAAAFAIGWRHRATWGRHLNFLLASFILFLTPVLGLIGMSFHRVAWVSDHFVYFALVAAVAALVAMANRAPVRFRFAILSDGAALALTGAAVSHTYAGIFYDPVNFYSYAIAHSPDAWLAENDLGVTLESQGTPSEAKLHFKRAESIKPNSSLVHFDLGNCEAALGELDDAGIEYETALHLRPSYAAAADNLGNALSQQGRYTKAADAYYVAIAANPRQPEYYSNLGVALAKQQQFASASDAFENAVRLAPQNPLLRRNLANAYLAAGKVAQAIAEYHETLRLNPNDSIAARGLRYALNLPLKSEPK